MRRHGMKKTAREKLTKKTVNHHHSFTLSLGLDKIMERLPRGTVIVVPSDKASIQNVPLLHVVYMV